MHVYIDEGPDLAALGEVAAWSFDLEHWGECGQGATEAAALASLARRTDGGVQAIVERIGPDATERVFAADRRPASAAQIEATLVILQRERARTLALVSGASAEQLAAEDADIVQPRWMRWRTAEAIAWHIADTESRHYLRLLGCGSRPALADLTDELAASGAWIRERLQSVPVDAAAMAGEELWTLVKVLRRLAWHERVESVFLRRRLRAAGMSVPTARAASLRETATRETNLVIQPTLRTARLTLVPLSDEHLEHEIALDADARVMRYLGDGRARRRQETSAIHRRRLGRARGGLGFWAGFADDAFVGWWLFVLEDDDPRGQVELGYRLASPFWGRGLASEGAAALLDYGFGELGLQRVFAETMAVNLGSRGVMRRLGMTHVDTRVPAESGAIPGSEEGDVDYGITAEEWAGR